MDPELVQFLFIHHPPTAIQTERYEEMRKSALSFALCVLKNTPKSPDQSVAIRTIREAVMWANSSVANEGRG